MTYFFIKNIVVIILTNKINEEVKILEETYNKLQRMGFSQYESKAYISLLRHSPATGYDISKRSGVPRSMIYQVLGKLTDRGAVHLVPSNPVTYTPVPANHLIGQFRLEYKDTLDYLEEKLSSLESERKIDVIHHIRGQEKIIKEMIEIINKTEKELWLSVWENELEDIYESVEKMIAQGVDVFTVLFGAKDEKLGATFHHNYMPPHIVSDRAGGRLTIVACDDREVLIANFSEGNIPWAVKTRDPALILIATEYIRHDIVIEVISKNIGVERLNQIWQKDKNLPYIVMGKMFSGS